MLAKLIGLLFGANGLDTAIAKGVQWAAVAAAVPAVMAWWNNHGEEVAVKLTWGQLIVCAGFVWAIVTVAKAVASARGPSSIGRVD
jgi:hypothetical protein